jgi:hypothetical protein
MLLLTSQHWFEAAPLEPEPVPVPCAFAKLARPSSATPETAARAIFFMEVSSILRRRKLPAAINAHGQSMFLCAQQIESCGRWTADGCGTPQREA